MLGVWLEGQDWGGGGAYDGKKRFVYLKWASHFWLPIQNFMFPQSKFFLVLGGWVGGWVGGLALVGGVRVPPPPPVDKHIPRRVLYAAPALFETGFVRHPVGRVRSGTANNKRDTLGIGQDRVWRRPRWQTNVCRDTTKALPSASTQMWQLDILGQGDPPPRPLTVLRNAMKLTSVV